MREAGGQEGRGRRGRRGRRGGGLKPVLEKGQFLKIVGVTVLCGVHRVTV